MGISLYGLTPATTYDALIKTGDNAPIDATLKPLSDGVGTNLPMEASTTSINFTGSLLQGGVAVPTAAQVAAKQDTLVSGTNIKTINGTSVLGSGNITTPNVSGVAGAIQFSNGSAFASDAANFFWDNTNKRLGVGTNAPLTNFEVYSGIGGYISHNASSGYNGFSGFRCNVAGGTRGYMELNPSTGEFKVGADGSGYFLTLGAAGVERMRVTSTGTIVKGSGSTSATTSLLVQNSAGQMALQVTDDKIVSVAGRIYLDGAFDQIYTQSSAQIRVQGYHGMQIFRGTGVTSTMFEVFDNATTSGGLLMNVKNTAFANMFAINYLGQASMGTASPNASAQLQIDSTTRGFLPPRMTTTQKNAISSPAAGLVVYDSTTNKLQCYNGSTWNDLF